MINVKNGECKIKGHPTEIMADICVAIEGLKEAMVSEMGFREDDATNYIKRSIDVAFMSEQELEQNVNEILKRKKQERKDSKNELLKLLKELVDDLEEVDEESEEGDD